MRIKNKLLYIVGLPLTLSLLLSVTLIIILTSREMHKNLEESINRQNNMLINHVSALVTSNARSYLRATNEIVNREISNNYLKGESFDEMITKISSKSFLTNGYIYLVNRDGTIVYHPDQTRIGTESVNRNWLIESYNISENFFEYEYRGRDKLLYKIYNPQIHLYVISTAYIDDFARFIDFSSIDESLQALHIEDSGYPILLTTNGICISHPDRNIIGKNITFLEDNKGKAIIQEIMARKQGWINYDWLTDGEVRAKTMYFEYDRKSGLYICTTGYLDEYSSNIDHLIHIILFCSLIIFIISLLIMIRLSNIFLSPIQRLTEVSKEISMGNLQTELIETDIDEINTLSKNFNQMKEWIRESIHTLESKVDERTVELVETVTRLEETREQLIQSEKMSSMGKLVAGVAHEINTPLGVCVTTASYLQDKTDDIIDKFSSGNLKKSDLNNYLEGVELESRMLMFNMKRATDLVKSFKRLSVDEATEDLLKFNVENYIDELLLTLRHTLKTKDIEINIECDSELVIESYPGLLTQVLTNLLLNSYLHGFHKREYGKIHINIHYRDGNLILEYFDNGIGITDDNLKKIYDPFFTTKRHAGGSGLGLHIVYNIISTTLNGKISCQSKHGSYTRFHIEFPVTLQKSKVGI